MPTSALNDNSAIGELLQPVAQALVEGLVYALRDGGTHHERLDTEPPGEGLGLRHARPLTIRTGAQALLLRDGSAVDFFLGMDMERWGVAARWMRSSPRSRQSGSALMLAELRIAWALHASEFARLRLEAGAGALMAPDTERIGPMAGLSFEGCMWGPLDLELRALVTPLPYRQVDGSAGLAAHVGALVVRGGVRGIYLDHAGVEAAHARDGGLLGLYLGMGVDF
ncbi:hypothetical protein JGU66_03105 [Myxococcaceae bacterium JPH2]|nr:hypothetical protein [Myxococcaceae bacterium JPH2]